MGERLKEASCINLSLTTLNHVIMSICRGQRAPPFRDSVLTRLLQVSALSCSSMLSIVLAAATACANFCSALRPRHHFSTRIRPCYSP